MSRNTIPGYEHHGFQPQIAKTTGCLVLLIASRHPSSATRCRSLELCEAANEAAQITHARTHNPPISDVSTYRLRSFLAACHLPQGILQYFCRPRNPPQRNPHRTCLHIAGLPQRCTRRGARAILGQTKKRVSCHKGWDIVQRR